MGSRVYTRWALPLLGVLFFLEAILFLPTDPMLIVYCLEQPRRSWLFATVATLASVLGGLTGYWIGATLWHAMGPNIINSPMVSYVMPPKTFYYLRDLYTRYDSYAILIAGFTPVPYKAATLSAGFCRLPIVNFILFSIIGRGARFYLYAAIIHTWGAQMKQYIERYFNLVLLLALILIGAAIMLLKQ